MHASQGAMNRKPHFNIACSLMVIVTSFLSSWNIPTLPGWLLPLHFTSRSVTNAYAILRRPPVPNKARPRFYGSTLSLHATNANNCLCEAHGSIKQCLLSRATPTTPSHT